MLKRRMILGGMTGAVALLATGCGGGGDSEKSGDLYISVKYPTPLGVKLFDNVQIDPVVEGLGNNTATFSVDLIKIPHGLTVDARTGRIGGYVGTTGEVWVHVTVKVSGYEGDITVVLAMNVGGAVGLSYPSRLRGILWEPLSPVPPTFSGLQAGDVTSQFRVGGPENVNVGTLPTGITLDPSTGVLSGEPDFKGEVSFFLAATVTRDGKTADVFSNSSVTVSAGRPFTFEYPTYTGTRLGVPFVGAPPTMRGGKPGDTLSAFHLAAPAGSPTGALPPGMTLDAATGAIIGTPTATASFGFPFFASATYTRGSRSLIIPAYLSATVIVSP